MEERRGLRNLVHRVKEKVREKYETSLSHGTSNGGRTLFQFSVAPNSVTNNSNRKNLFGIRLYLDPTEFGSQQTQQEAVRKRAIAVRRNLQAEQLMLVRMIRELETMMAELGQERNSVMPQGMNLEDMSYEELLALEERMGAVSKRAASQQQIQSIPVTTVRSKESVQESGNCTVCLNEFEAGEQQKILPCCHKYHAECIDQWLRVNNTCPVCKKSIPK